MAYLETEDAIATERVNAKKRAREDEDAAADRDRRRYFMGAMQRQH
jgi:hypothetical protein